MNSDQFKPGVAAIIIIALAILICTLLFIFAKRQIMRFAQKFPTDGPHAPIGYDAPKKLCQEIERRLNIIKHIQYEPKLMNADNEFACEENTTKYKHIYRMKAIDNLKDLEDDIVRACGNDESYRRPPDQDLRVYLLALCKDTLPLSSCETKLINEFVESYTNARCDPNPDFGADEYKHYMNLLKRIKSSIIPRTVSKCNSQSSLVHRKSIKSGSSVGLKSLSSSPIKHFSPVTTDNSKKKDNETCV